MGIQVGMLYNIHEPGYHMIIIILFIYTPQLIQTYVLPIEMSKVSLPYDWGDKHKWEFQTEADILKGQSDLKQVCALKKTNFLAQFLMAFPATINRLKCS